jgi:hypothetical protein
MCIDPTLPSGKVYADYTNELLLYDGVATLPA